MKENVEVTLPKSGTVLGVDIGYSKKRRTTGACVATWTSTEISFEVKRLPIDVSDRKDWLQRFAEDGNRLSALAVDGPVTGMLDVIGRYRTAEFMLSRRLPQHIGKPGQSSSGNGKNLNSAANEVVSAVIATGRLEPASHRAKIHELAFVEAFPTTFLGVMLDEGGVPSHGARSDVYFQHLLGPNSVEPERPSKDRVAGLIDRLAPGRSRIPSDFGDEHDHEHRAAIVCAITALCVLARQYVAVGDEDGFIILPPRADRGSPGLQPWAWEMLQANERDLKKPAMIVERGGEALAGE